MSFSSLIMSLCCGTVGSGLYGRAGLSSGSADRSSHQPLVRAIVRSQCFQADSTSLGGIPGRLGTFRASRQVATIWICEKWHIQRERKRRHRDVSNSAISEYIIFVKSVTDRTEQKKRGKDCAYTSQREKDCAPTKKNFKLGLLTHLSVATRLARRAFAIHLAHV